MPPQIPYGQQQPPQMAAVGYGGYPPYQQPYGHNLYTMQQQQQQQQQQQFHHLPPLAGMPPGYPSQQTAGYLPAQAQAAYAQQPPSQAQHACAQQQQSLPQQPPYV